MRLRTPRTQLAGSAARRYHPPMTATTLDRFDIKLLEAVQSNAALTQDELAERAHLSRSQCSRRLQRLRDEGVIAATVALLDPAKLGLSLQVYVMVTLRSHSADDLGRFLALVGDAGEVLECCMLTGDADYLLRVCAADLAHFDGFLQRLLKCPAVAAVRSSIVLRDIKRTTRLPLPRP